MPNQAVTLLGVPGLEKTDDRFRWKLVQVAEALGTAADNLALAIGFETGRLHPFSPSVRNPLSHAVGLIQFTQDGLERLAAHGHHTTLDALSQMSAFDQLDWVYLYLLPDKGRLSTLGDVYLAIFAPAFIGHAPDVPIYKAPSKAYFQNAGLDRPGPDGQKKGFITVADAVAGVTGLFFESQKRPRIVAPGPAFPAEAPDPLATAGALAAGVVLVIAIVRAIARSLGA